MNETENTKRLDELNIKTILIVGAGIMGHGFAQLFSSRGLNVILVDQNKEFLSRARQWITENLNYMVELGELQKERVEPILGRITFTAALEDSAPDADFIIEAVSENLELKHTIFKLLDRGARPETIIASNTSSYDITEIASVTQKPERVIGAHWFHPPQITPCVEIIPGEKTSEETIARTTALMEAVGKVPTRCKSAPGFVGNRIQFAMVAEALAIVEEGLATPEEVDRIVKTSFGFRLGAYGPFEICDQAGLDTYRAVFEYLHGKIPKDQFKPPAILDKLTAEGRMGLKSEKGFYEYTDGAAERMKKERDKRLYARLQIVKKELNL